MKNLFKTVLMTGVISVILLIVFGMYKMNTGNYFAHNIFSYLPLMAIGIFSVVLKVLKRLWNSFLIASLLLLTQSCNYSKSNQQVLISEDCGITWEQIKQGEAVPRAGVNPCYMKVVIPNYTLQGETKFVANLKGTVKLTTIIDYDYSITKPLAFIKKAKNLGKANVDPDDDLAISNSFESAENSVIEKNIKDVAKKILNDIDVIDMDQSETENLIHKLSNEVLEEFGVYLNFITLTIIPDEQTNRAIDVATAMKIYDSRGLRDIGEKVIIESSGAAKIVLNNNNETIKEEDEE